MSTLFVSDLDGTLLDRDAQLSVRTRQGVQELLDRGVAFTIATARSIVSVRERVDLVLPLPIVTANGTFVDDLVQGVHLHVASLDRAVALAVWTEGRKRGVDVLVTTTTSEHGDRMFFPPEPGAPTATFLDDRLAHGDPRTRVASADEIEHALRNDAVTGVVAIDRAELLAPYASVIDEAHGPRLSVHLNDDYYLRGYQWLTIHDAKATKGEGVGLLRERFAPATTRVVAFGDQTNDLPLFAAADYAVATANAHPDVLAAADEVIGDHHDDAVIDWLQRHT